MQVDLLPLPEPEDYFGGLRGLSQELPDNILAFSRIRYEALQISTRDYSHHRHVLLMNLGIPIDAVIHRRRIVISGGHFALVHPYVFHRFLRPPDSRGIAVLFVTFELNVAAQDDITVELGPVSETLMRETVEFVRHYRDNDSARRADHCRLRLAEMLLDVRELAQAEVFVPDSSITPAVVNRAVDHIIASPGTSADQVAIEAGASPSHLRKLFHDYLNCSVGEFRRQTRINRARYYLATSIKSISEIGELCGYASVYSFSRSFRQAVGESPLQYRHHVLRGDGRGEIRVDIQDWKLSATPSISSRRRA